MIHVAIIHTSRGRSAIAMETIKAWLDFAPYFAVPVEYRLGYESTEGLEYRTAFEKLPAQSHHISTLVFVGNRLDPAKLPPTNQIGSYLTATVKGNLLVEQASADWFVCVADNFMPWRSMWLMDLIPYFQKHRDQPTLLGYKFQTDRGLVSHPVFNRQFFNWHGRTVMRKEYAHTHGDADLYWTAKLAGKLRVLSPWIKPVHNHPYIDGTTSEDELHRLNYCPAMVEQGAAEWERRRKELGLK